MTAHSPPEGPKRQQASRAETVLVRRHLRLGWWSLFVFLSLGLVLEALHGFKVAWYLEAANTTRRFAFTLAHAHGTLLALINLALVSAMRAVSGWSLRSRKVVSNCLLGATVLLPSGFFLGGLFPHGGDPGLGILLVPVGGGLLALSVLVVALNCVTVKLD